MSVRPQTKDKPSPVNFQWDDPFMLDEQLTEDERMIRDTARAYAQDKLAAARHQGLSGREGRSRHLSTRWANSA